MGTTPSCSGGIVIRVLIVSPTSSARRELERLVAHDPGLVLVAASDSLESLGGVIAQRRPDVLLLDPGPESHLALPLLLEQRPTRDTTPVVVLLEDLDGEAGARALRAGARAALPRNASPAEIHAAVRAAAAGLASLPAGLATAVLDGKSRDAARAPRDTRDGALTAREREILALLGEGLVNKAIGVRLGISEHTVKTHLAAIYEKLEASNRAEAVATGLRRGLIML
jgi:DNA-binding NarL/FixJ family response regulator